MTGQGLVSKDIFSAAVMAGGESRRMGRNKALMEYQGQPLILRVIEAIEAVIPRVTIVAKDVEEYAFLDRPVWQDSMELQTPLVGIYTALINSDTDYVFVASCDMPFLVPKAVRLLCEQSQGYDISVPRWDEHYEPLCAVYSRSCIPYIKEALDRKVYKVIEFWDKVRVRELDENFWSGHAVKKKVFINLNRPEDWLK